MQSTIILTKGIRRPTLVLLMAIGICLVGCSKPKRPKGILDEVQLADLLTEIYVAEAKLTPIRIQKDSSVRLFGPWEEKLLAKRHISRKDFKETYRYYLDHPSDFEHVYEIITDSLNLREQRGLHARKKK